MDWDKLKIFHAVAESGSFTHATQKLGLSQSALSRQIRALEESLNISLFTRHARGLVLTQEGEQLFDTASEVLKKIERAEVSLLEAKDKPRGRLRVTTTVTFGSLWLLPHMKEFIKLYPDIQLEFMLSDDVVDLTVREADVAIRFNVPGQADLIQRQIGSVHHHIYASPQYLTQKGTPEKPADLDNHDLIIYGPTVPTALKNINWVMDAGATGYKRTPIIQVSSLFGVLEAVKAGLGLAAIPDYVAAGNPELVRILADIEGPAFKTFYVYPSELKGSKRVNLFRDFLIKEIQAESATL